MEQDEIIRQLNEIFIDIFEEESITINKNTTSSDIESWDSLSHIQMITAVEKHFKIHFELNELLNFKTVGDLCYAIQKNKTAAVKKV